MSGLGIKLGIVCSICVGAVSSTGAQIVSDWSEGKSAWTTQSYWQDENILQKYTFTPNKDDRVTGEFSMQVHMQVGAKRPRDLVELRLALPRPLDLSQAEAVELWLKVVDGSGLKARNAYFCSPGFKKLAIADWLDEIDMSAPGQWQQTVGASLGNAVGTAVTGRPPHRSVREVFPHTALAASRARKRSFG